MVFTGDFIRRFGIGVGFFLYAIAEELHATVFTPE
jgi:hypothetical protein